MKLTWYLGRKKVCESIGEPPAIDSTVCVRDNTDHLVHKTIMARVSDVRYIIEMSSIFKSEIEITDFPESGFSKNRDLFAFYEKKIKQMGWDCILDVKNEIPVSFVVSKQVAEILIEEKSK